MTYQCPVCGYPSLHDPPRSVAGGASDEICPSCGYQFGFTDDAEGINYEQWRATWIADGMNWRGIGIASSANWDPEEQLRRLTSLKRDHRT